MSEFFMECEEEELEPWQRSIPEINLVDDDADDDEPVFVGEIRNSEVTPNTRPSPAPVVKAVNQQAGGGAGAAAPTSPQRPPQATAGAQPASCTSSGPIVPQPASCTSSGPIVPQPASCTSSGPIVPQPASCTSSGPIVPQPASCTSSGPIVPQPASCTSSGPIVPQPASCTSFGPVVPQPASCTSSGPIVPQPASCTSSGPILPQPASCTSSGPRVPQPASCTSSGPRVPQPASCTSSGPRVPQPASCTSSGPRVPQPASCTSSGPRVPQLAVRATAPSITKSLLITVASRPGSLPTVTRPVSHALSAQSPRAIIINNQGYIVTSPQIANNSTFIASLGNQYPPGTSFTVLPAGQQLLPQVTPAKAVPGVVRRPQVQLIQNSIVTLANVQSPPQPKQPAAQFSPTKLQPLQMNAATLQPIQLQGIMGKGPQTEALSSLASASEELKRIVLESARRHGAPLIPWVGTFGRGSCQLESFFDQINRRPEFADHPLRDPYRTTAYWRNRLADALAQCAEARALSGLSDGAWGEFLQPLRTSGAWASDVGDYVLPGLAHLFRVHVLVYQTFYNPQQPTPIVVVPATVFGAEPFGRNPVILGWNSSRYENFVCTSDESLRRTAELVEEWRSGAYAVSVHDVPSLHRQWEQAEDERRQSACKEEDPEKIERNAVDSDWPVPRLRCRGCSRAFKRIIPHLESKGGSACRQHYSEQEISRRKAAISHHKAALARARHIRYMEKNTDEVRDGYRCRVCNRTFRRIISHLHSKGGSACRQHYSEQELSHHKAAMAKARKRRYMERNIDKVRDGNRVSVSKRRKLEPDKVREQNRAASSKRRKLQPDRVREQNRAASSKRKQLQPEKVREQNRASYYKRKQLQPEKVRAQNRASYYKRKQLQPEKVRAQNKVSRYRYRLNHPDRISHQRKMYYITQKRRQNICKEEDPAGIEHNTVDSDLLIPDLGCRGRTDITFSLPIPIPVHEL
ncbi:uncharacterized protein LOC135254493 isoform X3 [Anguilla rostrata]|uniref:uncharacterized protein LOC135254493 isoform X3 n=1 Tax=Anguilla rostrata TaxID=7938 RepID=UPI0030CDF912